MGVNFEGIVGNGCEGKGMRLTDSNRSINKAADGFVGIEEMVRGLNLHFNYDKWNSSIIKYRNERYFLIIAPIF